MVVVIVHGKATFISGCISFSPFGETGEGFDPDFPRNLSKTLTVD
jgi:inosine/xanthosine triphosphate pyrophosphatase family protein